MGALTSRLNLDDFMQRRGGRRRSQNDETLYSYSLNKNNFCNYFFMGGERFEVSDPEYLFGDSCDLNFLSCIKPHPLPYKQAQQNLLANLNTKQRTSSKVTRSVNRLSSPFSILNGQRGNLPSSRSNKRDAQTQTLNSSKGLAGHEASQPLILFLNIRKETLRLVKATNFYNTDSDLNSLTNNSTTTNTVIEPGERTGLPKLTHRNDEIRQTNAAKNQEQVKNSASGSGFDTANLSNSSNEKSTKNNRPQLDFSQRRYEFDISSLVSAVSSTKSGYTSVKEDVLPYDDPQRNDEEDEDDDEEFKDALNDTMNGRDQPTKEHCDNKVATEIASDDPSHVSGLSKEEPTTNFVLEDGLEQNLDETDRCPNPLPSDSRRGILSGEPEGKSPSKTSESLEAQSNRIYNIEFYFDALVDCSIRIFYFCTRDINSDSINYKPQHATYKSKVYHYKKGLNQKFEQQEHTFQPDLFDEDLLIYKPLDTDGNYNSGAVFPIVIHCTAVEGRPPKQSHSLIATVEKSPLDDSYSIKPLKQLIFADGVQYILQDIYGIEHKDFNAVCNRRSHRRARGESTDFRKMTSRTDSVQSNFSAGNLSDTASLASSIGSLTRNGTYHRSSLNSCHLTRQAGENASECVICMSDERDTMLLPCRHLCICSSCAQSLRYQANACPICRCPFKAALNLRPTRREDSCSTVSTSTAVKEHEPATKAKANEFEESRQVDGEFRNHRRLKGSRGGPAIRVRRANSHSRLGDNDQQRDSATNSSTPLLSTPPTETVINMSGLTPSQTSVFSTAESKRLNERSHVHREDDKPTASIQHGSVSDVDGCMEMRPMNVQWNKNTTQ